MFNPGDKITHWSDAHDVMTVVESRPLRTQVVCDDGVIISYSTNDLILRSRAAGPVFTLHVKYASGTEFVRIVSKDATGSFVQVSAFITEHRELMDALGAEIYEIRHVVQ